MQQLSFLPGEMTPGERSLILRALKTLDRHLHEPGVAFTSTRAAREWVLFNAMNGNRAEMSPEAAGIAACLMTYSHHACRTECYAMTVHYYRLRDYALQHPECNAIMRIID